MTNEELIQDMKDHISRGEYDGYALTNEECEQVIQALEQQRWIPVSERLPDRQDWGDEDYSDTVQVTILVPTGSYIDHVVKYAWYCFSEKTWYSERFVLGDVLAWKPLPTPYKAESEDKG